jgi:uncharacterized protein
MNYKSNLKYWLIIALIFIFIPIIISIVTQLWVLTAIPIGFLLGFFLQKGDLCGSSAMSEVILMRDKKKLFGFWIAIVISMLGFALLEFLGLVQLAPKPMIWLSAIIGGAIFGIGIVLGGGCVSGCLYKAATGNLNSISAVLTIPIGVAMVWFGPLKGLNEYLLSFVIKTDEGKAVTLSSLTGIPFWALALIFAIPTLYFAIRFLYKNKKLNLNEKEKRNILNIFYRSWKPWQAGIAIGILAIFGYLSSVSSGRNYPIGITHGVVQTYILATESNIENNFGLPKNNIDIKSTEPPKKQIIWWAVLIVVGLVIGSFVSGKMSGQVKLLPKPPEQTIIAYFGGFLIGLGAAIATGCVIGNILSGWALMSVGMFIFGFTTLIFNWLTTYLYLMGGKIFNK